MLCPQTLPSWRAGSAARPSQHTQAAAPLARSRAALRCRVVGGEVMREVLSRSERSKVDSSDDRLFYGAPRFTQHVDDGFLAQLTELYRRLLPAGGAVLDVGASHISHLPEEVEYSTVAGMGLNAEELSRNRRLNTFVVRNLNEEPRGWPHGDQTFDAVVCCVSIQYFQRPEEVMAEIYRVLKPGGVLVISFSNRMFGTKAIAAWRDGTGYSRSQLVKQYIAAVAGFTLPTVLTEVLTTPDLSPLGRLKSLFARSSSDPFYAVVAYRNFKREDH